MIVRGVITVLSGVGLYASLFMLRKSRRAELGELDEPSVVQSPRAKVLGVPNALLGALYYPCAGLAVWLVRGPIADSVFLAATLAAGAASLALAYSLLFITRRECLYCWTSHAANWLIAALSVALFVPNILSRSI